MTYHDIQVKINSLPIFSQNKPIKYVSKVVTLFYIFSVLNSPKIRFLDIKTSLHPKRDALVMHPLSILYVSLVNYISLRNLYTYKCCTY
jgi:hypothetical protein